MTCAAGCGGVAHAQTGSRLPSGRVVCAACMRRFVAWLDGHMRKRYRVGPKGKGAVYVPFPY